MQNTPLFGMKFQNPLGLGLIVTDWERKLSDYLLKRVDLIEVSLNADVSTCYNKYLQNKAILHALTICSPHPL